MTDYIVNLDAAYSAGLQFNTLGLFMHLVSLAIDQEAILASKFPHDQVKELLDKGLLLQSGNSLRFPKDIFKLV